MSYQEEQYIRYTKLVELDKAEEKFDKELLENKDPRLASWKERYLATRVERSLISAGK